MSNVNYKEIDIVVHNLIKVADAMIHSNPCPNKDNCEAIKSSRKTLYEIRDEVLDILNKEDAMADTPTQKQLLKDALVRGLRALVAFGVPYLLSWLAQSPNPKLLALGPVLMALGKYLRDSFGWDWVPV